MWTCFYEILLACVFSPIPETLTSLRLQYMQVIMCSIFFLLPFPSPSLRSHLRICDLMIIDEVALQFVVFLQSILVICMLRIHSVCSYRDSVSRACVAHWISRPHRPRCQHNLTTVKPKFHSARHVSSRHVRRVKPMHFGCVELVEQNGLTRSTRGTFRVETWRDVTSQVKFGFNTVLGVG